MLSTATLSRNRIVRYALAFLLIAMAGTFLFAVAPTASAQQDPFGLQDTYGGIKQRSSFIKDPAVLISNIVKTVLGLVGTVFFLLMLYAGFLWMTARGGQEQVKKAKDMISGAIVGLLIVTAAYAISNFIFEKISEPDVVLPTEVERDEDTIIDTGEDICEEGRDCAGDSMCGNKPGACVIGKCVCDEPDVSCEVRGCRNNSDCSGSPCYVGTCGCSNDTAGGACYAHLNPSSQCANQGICLMGEMTLQDTFVARPECQ